MCKSFANLSWSIHYPSPALLCISGNYISWSALPTGFWWIWPGDTTESRRVKLFFIPALISTLGNDPTFTVILLHWSNPCSLHAHSSNRRVPTWVLVPQLWSSSRNSERNASSLCPFHLGVVVTSLLFLISRSPYQLLANTSIIYVTNSLY